MGYSVKFHKPHSSSKLAFFLAAYEIIDAFALPVTGVTLGSIPGLSRDELFAVQKHNEFQAIIEAKLRERSIKELAKALPMCDFSEPLSPELTAYVDAVTISKITVHMCVVRYGDQRDFNSFLDADARVIAACRDYFTRDTVCPSATSRFAHVASYLNEGIPKDERNLGLTADHIRRAEKLYLTGVRKASASRVFPREQIELLWLDQLWKDLRQIKALDLLWREAAGDTRLKTLKGEALARRIHDLRGLPYCVDRATERAAA